MVLSYSRRFLQRGNNQENEETTYRMKIIFTKYFSDKALISRKYMKFDHRNNPTIVDKIHIPKTYKS